MFCFNRSSAKIVEGACLYEDKNMFTALDYSLHTVPFLPNICTTTLRINFKKCRYNNRTNSQRGRNKCSASAERSPQRSRHE